MSRSCRWVIYSSNGLTIFRYFPLFLNWDDRQNASTHPREQTKIDLQAKRKKKGKIETQRSHNNCDHKYQSVVNRFNRSVRVLEWHTNSQFSQFPFNHLSCRPDFKISPNHCGLVVVAVVAVQCSVGILCGSECYSPTRVIHNQQPAAAATGQSAEVKKRLTKKFSKIIKDLHRILCKNSIIHKVWQQKSSHYDDGNVNEHRKKNNNSTRSSSAKVE